MKELTLTTIKFHQQEVKKLKTIGEFKKYGLEIAKIYGISSSDALKIIQNRDIKGVMQNYKNTNSDKDLFTTQDNIDKENEEKKKKQKIKEEKEKIIKIQEEKSKIIKIQEETEKYGTEISFF
jgi:hypothetical protein